MKNLFKRAKYVLTGEDGASNVEFLIFLSVTFVIATALFIFGDKIVEFLKKAGNKVDVLKVS